MNDALGNSAPGGGHLVPTSRHKHVRRAYGLTAFLCVAIVLIGFLTHFTLERRSINREIANLEPRYDKWRQISNLRDTEKFQSESDKQVVLSVFRQCRDAEDIPNLGGSRIIAHQQGHEKMCMYVPQGSHTLEIVSTWKPVPASDSSSGVDIDKAEPTRAKTWSVPLTPACGYWLKFVSDRQGGPIQWELTSNHPTFKTQTDTVPLDRFLHRGSEWAGTDVVLFPNQIEQFSNDDLKDSAAAHPGVKLIDAKLLGPRDGHQYEVSIVVRLLSDGLACVSASGATRVIGQGWGDMLLPYKGDGKYEFAPSIQ